jgi:hypothetical protein
MKIGVMKRREFMMGGALAPSLPALQNLVEVEVMEVFSSSSGPSALLVHHADEATRENFANWLRQNSGKQIVCTLQPRAETAGRIFRVSLCFGRGLILLNAPAAGLRAKERIIVRLR